MTQNKLNFNIILYIATIIFAVLFLFIGNIIASKGMVVNYHDNKFLNVEAQVRTILDIYDDSEEWWGRKKVEFEAKVIKGPDKNKIITGSQSILNFGVGHDKPVTVGDKVVLLFVDDEWYFAAHIRIDKIIFLGCIFIILLFLFGKMKGLNAILSLSFTCIAIFAIFIPSILSGKNIYAASIIVCIFSIVVTLFIIMGITRKSFATIAGCSGGVIAAAILTLIMSQVTGLTGMTDGESLHLLNLPTERPIDLKAIIFAGIIIGAVGAIMDVAVSISSALWELKSQAPNATFGDLYKSGINIGKDIMGSMTNTLVLAYIGSSLTIILLLIVYADSFTELLNRELVIVEFLQALIGSLGILLTMPLTALICAILYSRKSKAVRESDKIWERTIRD